MEIPHGAAADFSEYSATALPARGFLLQKSKSMKSKIAILCSAALLAAPIHVLQARGDESATQPRAARESRERPDRLGAMMDRMKDSLDLTAQQELLIQAIVEDQRAMMDVVRGDESLDRAERRSALTELFRDMMGKIDLVLTPEQRETVGQQRQERRERMRERMRERNQQRESRADRQSSGQRERGQRGGGNRSGRGENRSRAN